MGKKWDHNVKIVRQTCCKLIIDVAHLESWSTIVQMRNTQVKAAEMVESNKLELKDTVDSDAFKQYKAMQDKLNENYLTLFFGERSTLKMIYNHPGNVDSNIRAFWNTFFVEYCPR